ncbi:hypothetical protein STEG23_023165 [Scotinomys teguina]
MSKPPPKPVKPVSFYHSRKIEAVILRMVSECQVEMSCCGLDMFLFYIITSLNPFPFFEPSSPAKKKKNQNNWDGNVSHISITFPKLHSFPDELYFEEGDIIYITDMSDTSWWKGTCKGRTGLIPSNYVAEQAESIDNPLHEAAKRGNLSWLRECLDNRVGVNGLDKAGSTALYWACHGGHKDDKSSVADPSEHPPSQKLFLETAERHSGGSVHSAECGAQPADVHQRATSWILKCSFRVLQHMLEKNQLTERKGFLSPSLGSAVLGSVRPIALGLTKNKLGDTALHAAAWKGYADIVQLLLEKGARTDLRNNEKKLALDMATNAACASLLKKKQGTDGVRTLSNAEDYLDDEDSD